MKTGISYFGNRMPQYVKKDMQEMVKNHCDFVVHTFSEQDLEFYKGTMKDIVQVSHEAGLKVYIDPWAVGKVFGGESYSDFILKNLDTRQVDCRGEFLPIACLNNEKFTRFMHAWIDAAIEIGGDIILWDEPHFFIYPEEKGVELWACRCTSCKEIFRERFGRELPLEFTEEIRTFKEDSIVRFIRELADYAKAKGAVNAFCFLPFEHTSTVNNWEKIFALESLAIIGTDPYWPRHEQDVAGRVRRMAVKVEQLARNYNKEGQIWIMNFGIEKGKEKNVEVAVDAAYQAGIRNIAAWSFRGGIPMSLVSDNPDLVWKTLGKAYKKLQST